MASKPKLTVIYSPTAEYELWEIWLFNAEKYGVEHANGYLGFLHAGIQALSTTYEHAKPVVDFPQLRSLTLQRSRKGDGHIVIFQVEPVAQTVSILHVYHTKMDVQGRLSSKVR